MENLNLKINSVNMFSVIWKYKIIPDYLEKFEYEYGPHGKWKKLFENSIDYMGSFLHRDNEEANVYLVIDIWKSKETYTEFIEKNIEDYQKTSLEFEYLYESEERIGIFDSVE